MAASRVVSEGSSGSWKRRLKKRQGGRARLPELPVAQSIRVEVGNVRGEMEAWDISEHGLSFNDDGKIPTLIPGVTLRVRVCVGDVAQLDVDVQVRHKTDGRVGCRVQTSKGEWAHHARFAIAAIELGRALEILREGIVASKGLRYRRYASAGGGELVIWINSAGQLSSLDFYLGHKVLTWSQRSGLRTGDLEALGHRRVKAFDDAVDLRVLQLGRWSMAAAASVPGSVRRVFSQAA